MSDLRSETKAAADKHVAICPFGHTAVYMHAALNGPPLLRALEALNWIANYSTVDKYFETSGGINMILKAQEALLEIEAARGSGEK